MEQMTFHRRAGERRLRILQVTEFYPPHIGGLERQVQGLAQELSRRGHAVMVASPSADGAATTSDGDVEVRHIASTFGPILRRVATSTERVFQPPTPDPGVVVGLQRLVDEFRPDIIHVHGWVLYSALAVPKGRDASFVVTLHDNALVCANRTLLRHGEVCGGPALLKCARCNVADYGVTKSVGLAVGLRTFAGLHRRLDGVIAVSSAVARMADARLSGLAAVRAVIPAFVADDVERRDGRARPGFLPPHDGYVLFVGALGRHKGVEVLLDAYRYGLGAPLVLLGTPMEDQIIPAVAGVTVAHNVAHGDVMAAWAGSSVAVVPSIWPEAFGLVAVEAMAAGKPVVASAIGGLLDIVDDGATGLLVPPGDAVALRDAVSSLVGDGPEAPVDGGGRSAPLGPVSGRARHHPDRRILRHGPCTRMMMRRPSDERRAR